MPLSSPDPAKVSSSEEGEATVAAVSTSEDKHHADLVGGLLVSSNFFMTLSVPEDSDRVVVSDGLQQLVIVEDGGQDSAELLKDSSIVMVGEAVSPSVDADDVQCRGIHKCAQVNVGSADDEQQVVAGYL
ncbi:hypothetical protein Dimus_035789 [Dionaea muscipula]